MIDEQSIRVQLPNSFFIAWTFMVSEEVEAFSVFLLIFQPDLYTVTFDAPSM